jgi:hypothetical protein
MRIITFSYNQDRFSISNITISSTPLRALIINRKPFYLLFLVIILLFSFSIKIWSQTESKQQVITRLTAKLQTGDDAARMDAAQELAFAGKDALPVLISGLKSNKTHRVLEEIVLTICLTDTDALPQLFLLLKENLSTGDDLVLRHGANAVACIAEASNQPGARQNDNGSIQASSQSQ